MRIWSIHPKYLDTKGLVAVWRETLLAKRVLEGKTKGYKNHPQLDRFKAAKSPVDAINQYLSEIYIESSIRNYNFNKQKVNWNFKRSSLTVTNGQLNYEMKHLLNKLETRDINKYKKLKTILTVKNHPLFRVIEGNIEKWENLHITKKKASRFYKRRSRDQ
jgi:hypothetical protein